MDFKLAAVLMAAFLFIGVIGGFALDKDEIKTITLPGEVREVVINQTELVPVADTSLLLDQAVSDFLAEVENDRALRKCNGNRYNFDEISLSEVDEEYSVLVDDEDFTVESKIELRYKESDLRSCYETFDVEAFYEEGEDVELTVN